MDAVDFTQWLIDELSGRLVPPTKRMKIYASLIRRLEADGEGWDPDDCTGLDDAFDVALEQYSNASIESTEQE